MTIYGMYSQQDLWTLSTYYIRIWIKMIITTISPWWRCWQDHNCPWNVKFRRDFAAWCSVLAVTYSTNKYLWSLNVSKVVFFSSLSLCIQFLPELFFWLSACIVNNSIHLQVTYKYNIIFYCIFKVLS